MSIATINHKQSVSSAVVTTIIPEVNIVTPIAVETAEKVQIPNEQAAKEAVATI